MLSDSASMGIKLWKVAYGDGNDNDVVAMERIFRLSEKEGNESLHNWLITESSSNDMENLATWGNVLFACKWTLNAFPVVKLTANYASALMCTAVPLSMEELIRPPWSAFCIQIPSGLFKIHDFDVTQVRVQKLKANIDTWCICLSDGLSRAINEIPSTKSLIEFDPERLISLGDYEFADEDKRASALSCRLVVSTCLAMHDSSLVRPEGKHKPSCYYTNSRRLKLPEFRTFRVGKEIKIDCTGYVTDFMRGSNARRGPIQVQYFRRGHWRHHQHYGPGNTLKKSVWIEPTWCGPIDAPINVRPHVGEMAV